MPVHLEQQVRKPGPPILSQISVIEEELASQIGFRIADKERQTDISDACPPVTWLGDNDSPRTTSRQGPNRPDSEKCSSHGADSCPMVLTPSNGRRILGEIDESLSNTPPPSAHPDPSGNTSHNCQPSSANLASTKPTSHTSPEPRTSIYKTTNAIQPAPGVAPEKQSSTITERGLFFDGIRFKSSIPGRRVVDRAYLVRFHTRTPLRPYLYQVQQNPFRYWIERRYGLSVNSEPLYLAARLFGSDKGSRRSSMIDYLEAVSEENGNYASIDIVYSSYTVALHCLEAPTPYPFREMNIHAIRFAENLQSMNRISSLEISEIDLMKILSIDLLWMVNVYLTRLRDSRLWLQSCKEGTGCVPPILGFMLARLDSSEGLVSRNSQWREEEMTFTALQQMLDLQFYHWSSLLEETADCQTRVREDYKVKNTLQCLFDEFLLSILRIPQLHELFKSISSFGGRSSQVLVYCLPEETPYTERLMLYFSIVILKNLIFEYSESETLFAAKVIVSLVIGQPWGRASYYRTSYRRWCALQSLLLAASAFHALREDDCLINSFSHTNGRLRQISLSFDLFSAFTFTLLPHQDATRLGRHHDVSRQSI